MYLAITFSISAIIIGILTFQSIYYNHLSELKFHNDEIKIGKVKFNVRNLMNEFK